MNISSGPPAWGDQPTYRLPNVLGLPDLERMRQIRNEVTTRALAMVPSSSMKLDPKPYREGHDAWMNYLDEDDLRRWMSLVAELLPTAIEQAHERIAAFLEWQRTQEPHSG